MNLDTISPLGESLLTHHIDTQKTVMYLQAQLFAVAVAESAKVQQGGGSFDQTNGILKKIRSLLFPELGAQQKLNDARTKKLLEREYNSGPMKVKALDYGGKKRKKRR